MNADTVEPPVFSKLWTSFCDLILVYGSFACEVNEQTDYRATLSTTVYKAAKLFISDIR